MTTLGFAAYLKSLNCGAELVAFPPRAGDDLEPPARCGIVGALCGPNCLDVASVCEVAPSPDGLQGIFCLLLAMKAV